MALQQINIGNYTNDGTGDDLRTSFSKINENFTALQLQGGQANTISNVGTGVGLYKEKIGVDLRLKTLIAGTGISLTSSANEITINNSTTENAIVTVNADTGTLTASGQQSINIIGGTGITTDITGTTLRINGTNYTLNSDNNPTLNANLNLNGHNIVGGAGTNITASQFHGNLTGNVTGNLTGLVNGYDVRPLFYFDFGSITNFTANNAIELFLLITDIDMGSITSPNPISINGGTLI